MSSRDAIEEFRKLYLQEYGVELTNETAVIYSERLINFVKAVYGKNLPAKKLHGVLKKRWKWVHFLPPQH